MGGLNEEGMTDEILREITTLEDSEGANSDYKLTWMHRVGAQRTRGFAMNSIKDTKQFGVIQQNTEKH